MSPIQKLELRGLSRTFGATSALYDFSLDIAGGAFVTLLGTVRLRKIHRP